MAKQQPAAGKELITVVKQVTIMATEIIIYSSAWCPYCIQAKRLLDSKGVTYQEIIVDGKPAERTKMMQLSGRRTVPQIWINDFHVGGCDDLFHLDKTKRLDALLNS